MPRSKRIVVTGIGPLTSIGTGVDNLWKSLLEKKTNIKTENVVLSGELWQSFKYHKIDNFNI
ncbi:MAG: beta-ketoacyl synthase N-terminal-like domain-containing protein, partial [Elusimicrobia bacterium]|nr:beta-ketoacyl synthase N-terminal-like domain-containing protein [Elusimicrobiota bacterium]